MKKESDKQDISPVSETDAASLLVENQKLKRKVTQLSTELENLQNFNKDLEKFAYVASHDLHEPLRMVSNFVQLLDFEFGDNISEEGKSYIQFAVDGVTRMQKLIDDLLVYNRVGKPDLRMTEIKIDDVIFLQLHKLKSYIAEKNAEVEVITSPLPAILGEFKQIGIIFYQLIKNGIQFNTSDKPLIQISIEPIEDMWHFHVKDNGIGIKDGNENNIYNVFYRLNGRPNAENTGIGLALCKKIVRRHSGEIWYTSEEGKGTTFSFSLPRNLNPG